MGTLLLDCDYLIVGAGIIGVSLARRLKQIHPDSRVVILEKESELAFHSSGRNSGVLHSGFYYPADSLKARFTRDGCARLTEYCDRHQLKILKCGKLVVAQTEEDLPQIDELLRRAKQNSVSLEEVSEADAKRIEPLARFYRRALWSSSTSVVDPKEVLQQLVQEVMALGVRIELGCRYEGREGSSHVKTSKGKVNFVYLVNCAGLYADQIAIDFGFSKQYRLLPFKGLYLKSKEPMPGFLKTNIYPVPNLRNPFLGVHFTLTVDGRVKIGPTAIPAFWREQYSGFERFSVSEMAEVIYRELGLFCRANFDFRSLAVEEIKKYRKNYLLERAEHLVNGLDRSLFQAWGPAGIRAQLLNIETRSLEMDYVLQGDSGSLHVLNAVSPAFTSSIPFAEYVCEKISRLERGEQLQ